MKNENESATALTPLDEAYLHATGPVTVGMTNDYMFRIVFQENKYALKGLISSVLHMDPDNIKSLDIKNTVKPGVRISDKEYRMDILVTMNDNKTLCLEMQLRNLGNWQYRSLSYLCREFDSLDHGDDYENVQPVYQIGFLGFTLFEDHPEFCSLYQMRNKKDNHLYTDRFNLIVIELNQEELASDEDIKYGIDKWVKLFKSKTWEELNMVAQGNEYMASAVKSMYLSNEDYNVIKVAREREEFLRSQAYKERKIASLTAEVASLSDENKSLSNENASLSNENASLSNEISSLSDENASLSNEISSLSNENASLSNEITRLRKILKDKGIDADN